MFDGALRLCSKTPLGLNSRFTAKHAAVVLVLSNAVLVLVLALCMPSLRPCASASLRYLSRQPRFAHMIENRCDQQGVFEYEYEYDEERGGPIGADSRRCSEASLGLDRIFTAKHTAVVLVLSNAVLVLVLALCLPSLRPCVSAFPFPTTPFCSHDRKPVRSTGCLRVRVPFH